MFYVEIQFANRTDEQTFSSAQAARIFASDVAEMYNAEEVFRVDNKWIVTVPNLKLEYVG